MGLRSGFRLVAQDLDLLPGAGPGVQPVADHLGLVSGSGPSPGIGLVTWHLGRVAEDLLRLAGVWL